MFGVRARARARARTWGSCACDPALYVSPKDQSEKRYGEMGTQSFFMCFQTLTLPQQPERFEKEKKKLSNKLLAHYSCRLAGISLIKLRGSHAGV